MNFFRTEGTVPPVEDLLNKLEAEPIIYSSPHAAPPRIAALRKFLEEEDVLRECRSDNERLIKYLARPELIMDLVCTTFDLPSLVGPARPDATGSHKSATSTETPQPVLFREQMKEHHLKHAHVASEILTSDNKLLSHAVVSDNNVMDKVFSYLEEAQPGQLHTIVAAFFAKLMVGLLKTRNELTTAQMAKREHFFSMTLLKHIDSVHIAELVVHILDSPEMEPSYNAPPTNKRPTPEALDLLANVDILGGLAESFFNASVDVFELNLAPSQAHVPTEQSTGQANNSLSSDARLGKHPLETTSSERPAQKPRSDGDDPTSSTSSPSANAPPSSSISSSEAAASAIVSAVVDASAAAIGSQTTTSADDSDVEAVAEFVTKSAEFSKQACDVAGDSGNDVPRNSESKDENAIMTDSTPDGASQLVKLAAPHGDTDCDLQAILAEVSEEPTSKASEAVEEQNARRRRLREETMANVTTTILGLTQRVLQLPELNCEIPAKLSVYETPIVISRLIDAGIYVQCNGNVDLGGAGSIPEEPEQSGANNYEEITGRVQEFSTGSNSALMHSLSLAAALLTTELNIYRDEVVDSHGEGAVGGGAAAGGRVGGGRNVVYAGKGIAASIGAENASKAVKAEDPADGEREDGSEISITLALPRLLDGKKEGDKIVSTAKLEKELSVRFERLASMFGEGSEEGSSIAVASGNGESSSSSATDFRPLGSLRLQLAEFFVACLKHSGEDTVDRIVALAVPRTLLTLFDQYRWSSMLHGVVTNAVIGCLEGGEVRRAGRKAWFKAGLLTWIIDSWEKNTSDEEPSPRWGRCGYMGHLLNIGTAVQSFLEDHSGDMTEHLPDAGQVERFREFAERTLLPAHEREEEPLCQEGVGGAGGEEEGEEATDVLEMGGIQFEEGLSGSGVQNNLHMIKHGVVKVDNDIEDEGEIKAVETTFEEDIKTVEVDDLGHFGADEEDEVVESVTGVDDEEISKVRTGASKIESFQPSWGMNAKQDVTKGDVVLTSGKGKVSAEVDDVGGVGSRLSNGPMRSGAGLEGKSIVGDLKVVPLDVSREDMERAVMDTVDSSSEDEGSYEAFVDDRKERTGSGAEDTGGGFDAVGLASQVEKLRVDDGSEMAMSRSLDGVVTEIEEDVDEEEALTKEAVTTVTESSGGSHGGTSSGNAKNLDRLAANVMRISDGGHGDDGNSSDDEYEAWEDATREVRHRPVASTAMAKTDEQVRTR